MNQQATFDDRKRPHEESQTNQQVHPFKKRKIPVQPAGFWETLSQIWLTTGALRELDRRNSLRTTSAAPVSVQRHRPVTRRSRTGWLDQDHSQFALQPQDVAVGRCLVGTSKDIKAFARRGGPDLTDLRGFATRSDPLVTAMSSKSNSRGRKRSSSKGQTETTRTKSSGPYSRNFQQALIDGGVYPEEYEYPDGTTPPPPKNWQLIQDKLTRRRASLSPSRFTEQDFKKFKRANAHASKERQIAENVIPILEGPISDARCLAGGIPFTNLDQLTLSDLAPSNPDRYYGARPEQLSSLIRTKLSSYIVPSTQHDLPILPNFFLAMKGPDGSLAVASRQASYDGAIGARAFESLRSYGGGNGVCDGNAYIITSIYHGGQLTMFTSHPSNTAKSKPQAEYFMTQIKSCSLKNDVESFRQGATWYRNGRDWAKEVRDHAIRNANEVLSAGEENETGSEADELSRPESIISASVNLSHISETPTAQDATDHVPQEPQAKRHCQSPLLSLERH